MTPLSLSPEEGWVFAIYFSSLNCVFSCGKDIFATLSRRAAKRGETAAQAERMAGCPLKQVKKERAPNAVSIDTLSLFFFT